MYRDRISDMQFNVYQEWKFFGKQPWVQQILNQYLAVRIKLINN